MTFLAAVVAAVVNAKVGGGLEMSLLICTVSKPGIPSAVQVSH
jgi:hypothetical protein